jgi:hypothetical protein
MKTMIKRGLFAEGMVRASRKGLPDILKTEDWMEHCTMCGSNTSACVGLTSVRIAYQPPFIIWVEPIPPFTLVREPDCEWLVVYIPWYHFVVLHIPRFFGLINSDTLAVHHLYANMETT